tara:strand:+ start:2489 stop:2617 length:129 start_codon:yes stop_codon:yes gene_type:complete
MKFIMGSMETEWKYYGKEFLPLFPLKFLILMPLTTNLSCIKN